MIIGLFCLFFVIRLYSLSISIKNEKNLIAKGAVQYGTLNSKILSIVHVIFYFSALFEAIYSGVSFDTISAVGTLLIVLALVALFWVIKELKEIWTVKLYILPNHQINTSPLFKYVRHPNYFLNIIPELLGVVLLCHAWKTLAFIFPIYLVILGVRIYQEEKAMAHLFADKA
ncbi:MAG: isoprenylcysteine carboxyl methyltransferase family protein [Pasteurellaceae bacterium]|nr:isoprenylcysteine carboxyl methyltransferase family protein [Pasteurellaceae bacterium]